CFSSAHLRPPNLILFPYTTLFRSRGLRSQRHPLRLEEHVDIRLVEVGLAGRPQVGRQISGAAAGLARGRSEIAHPPVGPDVPAGDRKSTRLNSSHVKISYAVFCLK